MSWLNELAGKAESLLNNIDQTAAVAISKASESEENVVTELPTQGKLSSQQTIPRSVSDNKTLARAKTQPVKRENERKNPTNDDALFNFLNSGEKVKKKKKAPGVKISGSSQKLDSVPQSGTPGNFEISRSSSFDSVNSKVRNDIMEASETVSEADGITLPDSTASECSEFEMVGSSRSSGRDSPASSSGGRQEVAENRILKSEIASMHQELTQVSERNKRIKEDLQRTNQDLRSRYEDICEEMRVKNSQVSVLQIKLNETEELLMNEKLVAAQFKQENETLLRSQSEGSGVHTRAVEDLRARLEEVEEQLASERKAHGATQQEALNYRTRQDNESKNIAESLQKSQQERHSEKRKFDELSREVKSLKSSLSSTQHEFNDYKQKAARILQSKERLISSLKGGESELTSSTMASIELEDVRQERDSLKDDVLQLRADVETLKEEQQDQEQHSQHELSLLHEDLLQLRSQLEEGNRLHSEAEGEVARLQEEWRSSREDASSSRQRSQQRLADKEAEIERLRNQLMVRSQCSPQESELESRLRQLTEAVIHKQTTVETLSAEKSSLSLRLERMEGQIKRLSTEGGNQVNLTMHDDSASQVTPFYPGGSHHGVVGKVKRAATVLDKFSIRLGIFLKRYPPARLFVLVYMALLHIWVMIVLLTYTPEIHGDEYHEPL